MQADGSYEETCESAQPACSRDEQGCFRREAGQHFSGETGKQALADSHTGCCLFGELLAFGSCSLCFVLQAAVLDAGYGVEVLREHRPHRAVDDHEWVAGESRVAGRPTDCSLGPVRTVVSDDDGFSCDCAGVHAGLLFG